LIWSANVGRGNNGGFNFIKVSGVLVASVLFICMTFTSAFGDFIPVTTNKVLGVGRIQSALPAATVASEDKFALAVPVAGDNSVKPPAELVEPIAREVATVEPDPEPAPAVETTLVNIVPAAPAADDAGWITTLATNYATLGDGFLDKKTASGALTSTTSMGVAHKSLPLGTQIEIYCPRTGLSCVAVVNDRGPYDGRPDTFDFQMGVTAALGGNSGWYTVQYRVLS
jgi:hypothetical protein